MLNEFKVRWHRDAFQDLAKKRGRSEELSKASSNTKKLLLLQISDTIKKIRS